MTITLNGINCGTGVELEALDSVVNGEKVHWMQSNIRNNSESVTTYKL